MTSWTNQLKHYGGIIRHGTTNRLARSNLILLVLSMFSMSATLPAAITVGGVNQTYNYSTQNAKMPVCNGITFAGGTDYKDGYLRINTTNSHVQDYFELTTSATPNTANDAISVVGTNVYRGTGTGSLRIGEVDGTENGLGGNPLKIKFLQSLQNGSFENNFAGWTQSTTNYRLVNNLNGVSIPIRAGDGGGTGTVKIDGAEIFDGTPTIIIDNGTFTAGASSARLYSKGFCTGASPGGVNGCYSLHGPYITSSPFSAFAGNTFSVDWKAQNGEDWYEVFGFLIGAGADRIFGTADDSRVTMFKERGSVSNWTTSSTTIAADGEYRFEFVCGSYDRTGGTWLGASLYVDNLRLVGAAIPPISDLNIQNLARLATFRHNSTTPGGRRDVTIQAVNTSAVSGSGINTFLMVPTSVTTAAASNITINSATSGGNVTSDGGASVTTRGVCWNTAINPTLSNSFLASGTGTGAFTANLTGLSANTLYYIRAYATNGVGNSYGSNETFVTIPNNVNATAAGSVQTAQFTANWDIPANGASSYRLDVSTSNTFATFVTGYGNLTVNSNSQIVSGLSAGTTYYYRVRAANSTGLVSGNSNTVSALTLPIAPTANAATLISDLGLTETWNNVTGATGYRVDLSTSNTFATYVTGYQNLDIGNLATYAFTGLQAGTTYYFRVRAYNGTGSSVNSNTITIVTNAQTPVATAASNLQTTAFTANWNAASGAVSYRLDVSTASDFGSFLPGFNNLTVNGTTANISGLTSGTSYFYRVRALNSASVVTANSNTISAAALLPQTISFAVPTTKTYGDADFASTATSNSGLTVTLVSSDQTVATISGLNIHIVKAGTCTITASQAGNTTYAAATPVIRTLTIDPKTLTATVIGNPTKDYNGNTTATLASTNYSLSGLVGAESFTVTKTAGTYATKDAGTRVVSVTLAAGDFTATNGAIAANYSLPATVTGNGTIAAKSLIAAVIGTPTKNYDGNTTATLTSTNYSLTGLVGAESFTVTKTAGTYATKDAGTRVVSVSLAAGDFSATNGAIAANYTLPTTVTGNGSIATKALTAALIGNPIKDYNGNTTATLASTNYSLSGLVGAESFTVTKTAGTYATKDAGTRVVSVTLAAGDFTATNGAIAANYTLPTTVTGNGTIAAKSLIAAVIGTPIKNYDGNTNATLTSTNFSLTGLVGAESFTVTKTAGTYASATAGPRNVTVSLAAGDFTPANGAVAANYTLPTIATGSGTINLATPVVQTNPSATSIVTGQALSSSTLSGGVVTGAGGAVIPGTFSFVTPAVIPPGGNYVATVIFTPTDGTNYTTITFTITIDVKHITTFAAGVHGSLSGTLTQNISQAGSSTAITANAAAGYKFSSWTVNSGSGNANVNLTTNPLTITNVVGPISLTANFIVDPAQTFALTVTAGAHGYLGAVYSGNYYVETQKTITAIPATGYRFKNWTGDVSSITTGSTTSATITPTMPASAVSLTANFEVDPAQTFAVTVTAGANGTLGANYNGNYAVETQIPITAVANPGYTFNGWTGNTSVLANPNSATTTLTVTAAAANLTANFVVDPSQTFAVTVTAGANGTLGANYNGNYAVETPISITAVPNAGYMFNGWTGNTSVLANPNSATTTLTVTANPANLTANFIVDPSQTFAVTVTAGANGTLGANYNGNYAVETQIPITAVPNAGYMFNGWTGNTSVLANPNSATTTLTVTAAAANLTANFIVDPSQTFAVTVTAGANGALGGNYNGNYAVETPISITAVPNAGYMFNGWTGNTSVLANPNSATTTLTVTAAAANLTANFIVDPSQTFAVTVTAGANGTLGGNYNGNYAVETPISTTAVPNAGYMFNGWTGNTSVLANPNSATTTLTVTASPANLTANFIVDPSQTFAVTVSAGANGTLGANYNGNYAVETQIPITAIANAGYMFNGWTGNTSVLANPNSATTTLTVTANPANLTANFIVDPSQTFAVTVTAGANGTLGANYNGNYAVETPISITAVSNAGYIFNGWTGNTSVLANPNSATTTLTVTAAAANLTANFIVDPSQTFAVTVTAGANGTLGANYNGNYAVETQIPITAVPNAGYMFNGWTGNTSVLANPNSATTTLTVTAAAVNLTANFIVDPSQTYAVTVTAGANGTLGANYNGNYAVETPISITAIPNTGYMFNGWTGNTSVLANPNSATTTLTVTAAAANLTANFIVDPSQTFALNLTLGAHGTSVTGAGNYNVEHVQTITAVAATGYRFKNWTGDVAHVANVNSATTTVTQPASTVNLTANFEIDYGQTFALTATAGANGSLAANYNGNYNTGSQVTLTAVPAVGYKFLNWTGNVSTLSSTTTATATLTMPAQNVNLTANFVVENEQLFALDLTLGAGGTAVIGAGNYPVTYQQQILATAATGYKFKNWTGDVAVITTGTANDAAVTVTMPAQATALTANFEVDPTQLYSLSVLSNNTQFGTASDLTNTAPYNVNTIVNIKAVPKTGYRFTGWVSSNGGTFGNATTAETTFEMPAKAVILTASFEVDPAQLFALTVSADANGTLGANYNGNYTVGTQMNLTAIPNTGYKFLNWTGDVAYIGNNSKSTTVTLTMPAAAVNLVANFVPETSTLFALNTTIGAGGASVTGAGSYPVDHQQQLVAHAAIGYKFKTWTGDTEHIITGLATDAIVTVKMPAAVVNLTATFEIDPAQAYTLSLVSANLQMGTVIDETATGPYTLGSVVNIKAVPTAGHRFTGWVSSNGGTIGNDFSAATTFTMPANNVLLTAGFEVDDGQTFALNVSAAPHGSLAANYNGYYHVETVKNISAAGDTGYRFKEWTGDVANISAGTITDSAVTVTMPATAVALVAGFEVDPNQFFALNLTLGAHGTSVTGAGNYNVEHVQTITAIAATGYKFANWTGDVTNVADVNSATTTITMPAGAVNLTANFIVDQTQTFALNLTLGAHGASVTGAGSYNVEHIQTITAVAATGYKFANWTGDVTNVADVNSATTTITMPASTVNLTANFIVDQAQTFALNLTLGAHGTSVTGTGNYYAEHIQTITAVATTGYKFANWTGDVTNVANVNSATTTITMPASAVNLTANFVVDQTQTFALNLTLGAHGTSVSGAGNYNAEHVQAITAVAATGYKFANWTGDVTNVANVNSATTTITMPASAVNLTANFIVDEAQTFALSLAANPAAYGNASLASGQAAGPYNAGTVVNVKAVANTGFKFVNWTKPDKEIFAAANKNSAQKNREVVSTLPEFGYTMTAANTALTSNFKVDSAQTFALNITMSTGGQSVTGAGSYVVLHQQSITAVAAAGYQFKNWTGDISAVANANSATTTVTMPSAIVNLTATFEMIVPILAVSADNLNYGNVYIGAEPVQTLKIYNAGASTLVGSIAEVSSPFSFVQTKNNRIKARMQKNRLSFELGMTDTLRLNVKFKPQDINSFLETMFVTSNGSGISEKSVILQGSATADPNSEPVLTLWPDSLIYGSMLVNTSREKKFTLKNNGGKVLTGYIRFPVEHQSVYFSTAKNNSKAGRAILDSVAFSLTSGSVATYASLFTPDSARNYLENISVLSNDLTATGRRNIKVTATGLANGVTLSKNLIDFGKVRVGVAKDSTIMVKNNTAEPFVIYGIKGMNYGTTAAFTSANSSDTITIAANDSAAVNFRFKPQFPTAYRDTAKVFYNAEMTKYLPVYLAGTGEYTGIANGSALVIKPMVVDYGIIANDNLYKGHFTVKNQDIDSTVVGFSLNFDNKYIRVIEQGAIAKASKKGGKDYYFYYLHNGDSINFEVQLTMNSFAAAQITGEQFLSKVWLYSNATSNPNQFVTLKGRTGAVEPGLSAFSLLTPADNHKPYANNIDLSWQSAKNASISGDVEYTAYIITPTDSIALPTTATTVNSGKQLKFNQKYEWTVKAKYGYQEKWANEKWSFELQQKGDATPNPFTPDSRDPNFATTKFDLFDKEADLSVKIYSIGGKFISHVTLIKQIDRWTASWDGKNRNGDIVGPGVYLYQVYTGNKVLRNGFIGVVR